MSKREQIPPSMGPFSPAHQTDEGYSEDPLNPTNMLDPLSSALSSLRSPTDLPQWLTANSSLLPVSVKARLAMALLDQLPTSSIVEIVERLSPRLYIDFIRRLPAEICLKILRYLDPISLVSVLQTCRAWYDLALDRKLWENLYYLEGWKAFAGEIEAWEGKVNAGVNNSIGHLYKIQHTSHYDDDDDDGDLEMTDRDRLPSIHELNNTASIFGAPSSSSYSPRRHLPSLGDMNLDSFSGKGKGVDRGGPVAFSEGRAGKRKEPGGHPEMSLPQTTQADDISSMMKSTLWTWDMTSARYRVNWRHLYNMRRRLESNWELGKYTTFVLPHPDYPEEGHQECVYTLQFDSNYLVSGSRDRTMRVWDMHTRRLVRQPLQGHEGSVLCLQFDADPSEDILVSGSSDSNVFIWKFSTGEIVQRITTAHQESVLNVRFDKRILVTSSKDKTIKIFNRRPMSRSSVAQQGADQGGVDPVGIGVKAYGYEPDLSQELALLPPWTVIAKLEGHGAAVNAIQVQGRMIVSVSGDRQIKLWNWPEEVCVQTIPAHEKGIACVEFDGRRIVSGSSDYDVCIFDALTGLKIASLRGHAHLVRTVQAGFADLPYSKAEDEAEAKRVDAEYFRAVEAGEVDHEGDRRFRRTRRANAGSSRPNDLQAYGAKVPPGGGGGRKYARIVSGSYDQSIIIWRRDKEGVWKSALHLRQEEAADAAYRQAASSGQQQQDQEQDQDPDQDQDHQHRQHRQHRQHHHLPPGAARPSPRAPTSQSFHRDGPASPLQDAHKRDSRSAKLYRGIIDQVVPLGTLALRRALGNNPSMLIQHSYLQSVIEQEASPIVRMQMRQIVADALVTIQNSQSGGSAGGGEGASGSNTNHHHNYNNDISEPEELPRMPPFHPFAPSIQDQLAGAIGGASTPTQHSHSYNAHVVGQAPPPHSRFATADYAPARVFKLQFDARRIICCTQAPILVGWDFCNGDPELEEAARFFATVD